MPRYTVSRIMDALNDHGKAVNGSNILVLGVAYKPNIDDIRESPALDVIGLLKTKGAEVSYHDPFIPSLLTHEDERMESVSDLMGAVKKADCVVIITNHDSYNYSSILADATLIFDSRNALGKMGKDNPKVVIL